ncbi:MAG: hypothetical protein M3N12_02250 [Verrucomicrobiota bacterium]|nr:hypothetical protein [Verrucomicrobiota bacterium]
MADSSSAPPVANGSSARLHQLIFLLGLLPMALVAAIINHYGVNVPYGDEWNIVKLLGKWDAHELSFADLYSAHNGHRILIPRLIYFAIARIAHGNLRVEMLVSLFLCILTSAGFYLLLRRTVSGSTTKHLALWGLINLFLFSPIQAENWLWGFQLQVFLSNLCLVGALVCVTRDTGTPVRFLSTLAFALAGTFSFGNGLLIWPAVFLVLLCRREKFSVLALWLALAVLVALAYLPGYPAREPTPTSIRWFDYLLYFAGFLGAPLARIPNSNPLFLPVLLGSILVALFLCLAARPVPRREALRNAAPWLALGAYVIASAVMAARARIHSGPAHALDSRYTTISSLLLISLIGLVTDGIANAKATSVAKTRILAGGSIAVLLVFYAVNAPFELRYLRLNHSFRALGKSALEFSAVLDLDQKCRALLLIRQDPETFARSLGLLDRLKLLDPPRRRTTSLTDAEGRSKRTTDEFGKFENVQFGSADVLVATGWSYLPIDSSPPAGVLLAYRDGEEWKVFALSEVTERRQDLTTRYKSDSYLETGWRLTFPRSLLPAGEQEISAWALAADRDDTYRLPGSFRLQR